MELEEIMLSEISHAVRLTFHVLIYFWEQKIKLFELMEMERRMIAIRG